MRKNRSILAAHFSTSFFSVWKFPELRLFKKGGGLGAYNVDLSAVVVLNVGFIYGVR